MDIGIVHEELNFVIKNTPCGSLERVKQLAKVFAAYAEDLEALREETLRTLAQLFMEHAAAYAAGACTSKTATADEAAKQLPILVQQTLQLFAEVAGAVEGAATHAVWQSAWQGWQKALTPLRVDGGGRAAEADSVASWRQVQAVGAARILALLQVTLYLEERAAGPSLSRELGSAAIMRILIYLQVFQGIRRSSLVESLRAALTPAVPCRRVSEDKAAAAAAADDEAAGVVRLVFHHLVASLQMDSFAEMCAGSGTAAAASAPGPCSEAEGQAMERAQNFLISWRRVRPQCWDACTAALLESLVATAGKGTRNANTALHSEPGCSRLCALLASPRTAAALATTLVSLPSVHQKGGPRLALDVFAACYGDDSASIVAGASLLLTVSSNMPLEFRVEACSAMQRAADRWLGAHEREGAAPRLWSDAAVAALLDTLTQDASLRVRRATMRLLSTVAARDGSEIAQRLVHTIALKCRDKDPQICELALKLLTQLPAAELHACLSLEEWQCICDAALEPGEDWGAGHVSKCAPQFPEEQPPGIASGDSTDVVELSERQQLGQQLLRSYLRLDNASAVITDNSRKADGASFAGGLSCSTSRALLEAIERIDVHSDTVSRGLFAAYQCALQQLTRADVSVQSIGAECIQIGDCNNI